MSEQSGPNKGMTTIPQAPAMEWVVIARIVGPFSLLLMLTVGDLPAWFLISVLTGYGSLTLVAWIWTEARHSVLVMSAILASNAFVYSVVLFEIARTAVGFGPAPLWALATLWPSTS